jgi:hypothetical protein
MMTHEELPVLVRGKRSKEADGAANGTRSALEQAIYPSRVSARRLMLLMLATKLTHLINCLAELSKHRVGKRRLPSYSQSNEVHSLLSDDHRKGVKQRSIAQWIVEILLHNKAHNLSLTVPMHSSPAREENSSGVGPKLLHFILREQQRFILLMVIHRLAEDRRHPMQRVVG